MKDFDEMRNIDVEYEPMVKQKKKGGFFGKFVALLLGLILGIVAAVGGVAWFGWYTFAKMPIEKGADKINDFLGADIDYTKYIDKSYGEKTIADLVGDVVSATGKIADGEGTLNTLNDISPLVAQLISGEDGNGGLVGTLAEYAIIVDPDKAMNRILFKAGATENNADVYFGDYLFSCIENASLGDVAKALGYGDTDVINTICYGTEGVDYILDANGNVQMINGATKLTIGEFVNNDLEDTISVLPVDSLVTIDFPNDSIMCTLAYGADYRYEKQLDANNNVVMKQVFYKYHYDEVGRFILKDDEGNDVTADVLSGDDAPENGLVITHRYTENGKELIETRYLKYEDGKYLAFEDEAYTTPILFKKHTLGMLSEGTDSILDKMYVKDLLGVDETDERIMIALCYGSEGTDWEYDATGSINMIDDKKPRTVNDLKDSSIFYQLTLKDLLGDDVEDNMILHSLANTTIEDLPEAMNELTFDDIFADQIYEYEEDADGNHILDENGNKIPIYVTDENGQQVQKVSVMWDYLFDDPSTPHIERPNEYYLLGHDINHPGVDQMIDNMQANMQTATLEKLVRDDLITFSDDPSTPENEAQTDKEKFLTDTAQKKILVKGELKYVRELTVIEMISWAIS
ncbi:MAG: hypothetical protein E7355_01325 [Clostridiales bacterium]|nr:hypothetical protein [Clostridiales bacterium]